MPRGFQECVRRGGRVRRKSLNGKYINICYIDNKSYAGEVHVKKKRKKK
jgi:hypothetical protein